MNTQKIAARRRQDEIVIGCRWR